MGFGKGCGNERSIKWIYGSNMMCQPPHSFVCQDLASVRTAFCHFYPCCHEHAMAIHSMLLNYAIINSQGQVLVGCVFARVYARMHAAVHVWVLLLFACTLSLNTDEQMMLNISLCKRLNTKTFTFCRISSNHTARLLNPLQRTCTAQDDC